MFETTPCATQCATAAGKPACATCPATCGPPFFQPASANLHRPDTHCPRCGEVLSEFGHCGLCPR